MISAGLEQEVNSLLPYFSLNALQTVGYREWLAYFNKEVTLKEVINSIQQNTRHYAKRQMTWFKKDSTIRWFDATNPDLLKTIFATI